MKKIISIVLVIASIVSIIPMGTITAFAAEKPEQLPTIYNFSDKGFSDDTRDDYKNGKKTRTCTAYLQYYALRNGKISVIYIKHPEEDREGNNFCYYIEYKGEYFYRFDVEYENKNYYLLVSPEAFKSDVSPNYTNLNKELSYNYNILSADMETETIGDSEINFPYVLDLGKTDDTHRKYISWLDFDSGIENGSEGSLLVKKNAHVLFTYSCKPKVYLHPENPLDKSVIQVEPYDEVSYRAALNRNITANVPVSFTPCFDVTVLNESSNVHLSKVGYSGKGVSKEVGKYDDTGEIISFVFSVATTTLSLALLIFPPTSGIGFATAPAALSSISSIAGTLSSLYGVYDSATKIAEKKEKSINIENKDNYNYDTDTNSYVRLTNSSIYNEPMYCYSAIFKAPKALKDSGDNFKAHINFSGKLDNRKNTVYVKFFTLEDSIGQSTLVAPVHTGGDGGPIIADEKNISANKVNSNQSVSLKFSDLSSSDIKGKSAKISGKISNSNYQKISSIGIYLKKDSYDFTKNDIAWSNNNASTDKSVSVSKTINSLEPNTKYYYRIYATVGGQLYYSEIKSFKTPKVKPENTSIASVKTIDYRTNKEINSSELGVGDTVKVKWNAAKYAEWYTIKVNGVEDKTKIYGTEKILKLDKVGSNTISICAHNDVGSSAWTAEKTATVHEDVTLSFVIPDNEGNNNEFESHTLTWNHDLPTMPEAPSRIGSVFSGWYKDGEDVHANVRNVKEDTTLYARYVINTYTVKFTDNKGNDIEVTLPDGTKTKEQKVKHGEAAIPPADSDIPVPEGYRFLGWNADYSYINDPITIKAVIDKLNYSQPVKITSAQAVRYDGRYEVICTVNNETLEHTQGRIVVALKTDAGHLITTTESTVYFVERNEAGTDLSSDEIKKKVELKVLIPVDEIMDAKGLIADYVEIYAVENFKSTVPVAGHYTVRVRDDDKWSSWSTENPEGKPGVGEIQPKTQYRYKELQKTTVNTTAERNNLVAQGWTFYSTTGPKTVEGNWTRTKPAALEYRTISEKTVTDYKTVKKYCYKRYAYQNSGTWWSYSSNWANNHGCKGKWEYKFTDKPLKEYKSFDGKMAYGSASDFWWAGNVNKQGDYTSATVNRDEKSGSHKEYKAIDKIYTYHLQKWTNFSDWQDAYVEQKPDQTNQVQTQTVYRYQTDLPKRSTTDTTNQRDDFCVGNLGTEYAGKQVTLFIYKVTEASDWTTEYVAQTVVDPEGNYFFEPYILREEPTAITGDFTVTLGIEGADSAMYLGKIEVPDSEYEYTVTFKDKDDSVIDTQVVFRGEDAVVPEIPVHEGYTFSHWDMRCTDIRANTIINAIYIPNVYDVTYYDPMNTETPLTFGHYDHNAELVPPEAFDTAELKFIGWDKVLDGVTNIKENMVVTALYEPMTYEVTFNGIDNSGEVLSVQSVEYGDAPVVPEVEVPEDMIFFGWQAEGDETLTEVEMLSVTENTQLYPQYMFVNTTETPVADLESGSYSSAQTVRLSCDTESAVIYYTTDGTDPMMSETALEYNKATGIKVSDTCQLRFIATAFNMNVSQEATALYAINDGDEADKFLLNLEVPEWGTNAYTGIVNGGMVLEDGIPEYYGYTVAGAYLAYEFNEETGELTFSEPWDISTGTITEDKTIYLDYDANTYTVEFVDYDGVVLSEESVPYLSSAIAPEVSSREGYVFIGWDTDEYAAVTENLTVNAVYVPEDEYVTIELNRSSYTMMSGNTYTLTATTGGNVEKPEIIWASSDENVAVVDDNGVVTATGKGSAEIYAIIVDNGETATCKINVVGNPSDELTLVGKAHLSVDDYGYIRGFTISTDAETQEHYAETVAEVKSQFLNNELVFTDINGNVLSDDDSVGTGTVIKLMDGNKELDSITVVVSGDMDGDGYVTNKDASRISRYLVNKESPTEVQICAMDVNGDGYVNNRDASVVSRYLVGKETI